MNCIIKKSKLSSKTYLPRWRFCPLKIWKVWKDLFGLQFLKKYISDLNRNILSFLEKIQGELHFLLFSSLSYSGPHFSCNPIEEKENLWPERKSRKQERNRKSLNFLTWNLTKISRYQMSSSLFACWKKKTRKRQNCTPTQTCTQLLMFVRASFCRRQTFYYF